jgi:hypothetical protein
MKNIHVLPTDKPSRIKQEYTGKASYCLSRQHLTWRFAQHIYITSDEEIKEGGYVFWEGKIYTYREFMKMRTPVYTDYFSIILTTDQDLIADGVQSINDEFLEWFVNNPSCEEVGLVKGKLFEIEHYCDDGLNVGYNNNSTNFHSYKETPIKNWLKIKDEMFYKIIIPQEEPKQELNSLVESWQKRQKEYEYLAEKHRDSEHTYKKYTYRAQATRDCWKELLTFNKTTEGYYDDFKMIEGEKIEEAAKRFWKESKANPIEMAIFGAEWQQEQDVNMVQSYLSANLQNIELLEKRYSQEEVDVLIHELINKFTNWSGSFVNRDILIEIYEQFKKK